MISLKEKKIAIRDSHISLFNKNPKRVKEMGIEPQTLEDMC